jgi:hypothetical protein
MALRNATPLSFSPQGVSDALDSTNVFGGAMAALSNLIPDPTTKNLWQCRPAALKLTSFAGFTTPGFVSAMGVIGNLAYGLIATGRNAGQDEPFAYNLLTQSFVTISGVTAANTPTSPATSGAWTPPSMALIGTKLIFTHPGFNFGGGFAFGVLDISNPAAPAWSATNTSINALPALPSWVANFNGRAWFLVNPATGQPGAYFTDVLIPTQITNAAQVLTFDDNLPLTCAAGLGLYNQQGGIIQALMVFKGTSNIYQVTGDSALNTLAKNSLNVATGTLSPLSVTPTPRGLTFLAPDGLRMIDFTAKVTDPVGVDGEGVNAPFIYSTVPSRVQASSNQNVLRISVQNGLATGSPQQEWWYDISRHKWSGPHTFPASMIAAHNNTFIMTPVGVTGSLWQSDVAQSATSTFVENGVQLAFMFTTCLLPDAKQMCEFQVVETTVNMALIAGQQPVSVQALDQNGSVLGSVLQTASGAGTLWGQFNWGQALWGGAANALAHRDCNWTQPLVFSRMQLSVQGNSILGFKIGDVFLRYQKTGYLQRYAGAG